MKNLDLKNIEKDYQMRDINIDQLVCDTLTVANKVAAEKDTLFNTIKRCINQIKDDELLVQQYKKELKSHDVCRSTIFIMINVAQSYILMKHQKQLPSSYQTLYECLKLLNEVERSQFEELIEIQLLNTRSTKADVIHLRKTYKSKLIDTDASSPSNNISYSEVLEATQSLSHNEKLNMLEYLIESLTDEERQGLISMYIDEVA